jgi:hypothetical protein
MRRGLSGVVVLMVAALLLSLPRAVTATAQTPNPGAWTALGPSDKPVSRLFTPTSGALFAMTADELFRSDDGGLTWATVQQPSETNVITVSPVDHQLLYAAGSDGIYRSVDGGANWEHISDEPGEWSRIEVSPADPNLLYGVASTETKDAHRTVVEYQIRVSRDAGVSWEVVKTYEERRTSGSYPCGYAYKQFQPHHVTSGTLLTIEGCTVRGDPVSRLSTDEGRTSSAFPDLGTLTWSAHSAVGGQGVRPGRWYVSAFRSNILYTRVHHSKVLRTDDDGNSWTTVFEDDSGEPYSAARKPVDFVTELTYDPRRPDDVFAVFEQYALNKDRYKELEPRGFEVRMSRDAGMTWASLGSGDLPPVSRLAVGVDGRYLFAGTKTGVYRIALGP